MRRIQIILMLLALSANLTTHAQPGSPVLVTVELSKPSASTFLDRMHPKVYYATGTWALVELSPAQVELARRAGCTVTVIDSRPDPDGYRLVTKKREKATRTDVAGADVLIERDGVMITRGDPSINDARRNDGLKSVPLRPLNVALAAGTVVGSPVIQVSTDSLIASIVARVNPDSVRWFIQQLQDFGTRYAYASTRDNVAEWIKSQFARMGYADARRDSFDYSGVWHSNVVATLSGSGSSGQVIVFGGHHDSNSGNPMKSAPGADDNASGTAAALETARILSEAGYVPEVTIKFATFAAEEIGLIGSQVDAARSVAAGVNIKLMINHDMIANNPGSHIGKPVRVYYYTGSEAWRELAKQTTDQFTTLVGLTGGVNSGGSDSYSYWSRGYPAVYFFEDTFSPVYHTPADTIGAINIDYCVEVIRASAATMLRATTIPDAVRGLDIADRGDGSSLLATWEPGFDETAVEYRVFVGAATGVYDSSFLVSDSSAVVGGLTGGRLYYVGVAPVDAQGDQGLIMEQRGTPRLAPLTPAGFTASPDLAGITLRWSANAELDLLGYNVYRSETPGAQGSLLTPVPVAGGSHLDATAQKHLYYYYTVRAADSLLNESLPSVEARSRLVSLDLGVVLVDETEDGAGTPGDPSDQQVDEHYQSLLAGFTVTPYDVKSEARIGLADMGAFSTVVWYNDDLTNVTGSFTAREDIKKYLEFGGKLLYTGYRPGRAFTGSTAMSAKYGPGEFMYDVLGIDSRELLLSSRFSGAVPLVGSYPAIHVDSLKASSSTAFHLRLIENIYAAPGGSEVYAYNSWYDTSDAFGGSMGKPVSIASGSPTTSTVVLSFPLYYMKQDEARALVRHILEDVFSEPTRVEEPAGSVPGGFALDQNYPNPFNPTTSIRFTIPSSSRSGPAGSPTVGNVRLVVCDLLGRQVAVLVDEMKAPGSYGVKFDARSLASGVYLYRLSAGSFVETRKMMLVK